MANCRRFRGLPVTADSINRRRPHVGAVFALVAAGLATGCSDGVAVSGQVAFDDQPIAVGTITFLPADDSTTEERVQSPIVDGAFTVASQQGLRPGRYEVAIRATRVAGKAPADEQSGEMVDRYEQYIPPQYNSRTELATVIDAQVNDLQFELKSPPRRR